MEITLLADEDTHRNPSHNKQIIEQEGWNILTHCLLCTLNQQYWFNVRHTLSYFTQLQITSRAGSAHIILFCRKGTDSNSSCVCFHNSIHFPDVLWWHAQTRANTTNCAVWWSHKRIRAYLEIKWGEGMC